MFSIFLHKFQTYTHEERGTNDEECWCRQKILFVLSWANKKGMYTDV